jgi:hypothetical protein
MKYFMMMTDDRESDPLRGRTFEPIAAVLPFARKKDSPL